MLVLFAILAWLKSKGPLLLSSFSFPNANINVALHYPEVFTNISAHSPGHPAGLHPVGEGDVVAPDVELPLAEADDAAEHVARVHAYPHVHVRAGHLAHGSVARNKRRDKYMYVNAFGTMIPTFQVSNPATDYVSLQLGYVSGRRFFSVMPRKSLSNASDHDIHPMSK